MLPVQEEECHSCHKGYYGEKRIGYIEGIERYAQVAEGLKPGSTVYIKGINKDVGKDVDTKQYDPFSQGYIALIPHVSGHSSQHSYHHGKENRMGKAPMGQQFLGFVEVKRRYKVDIGQALGNDAIDHGLASQAFACYGLSNTGPQNDMG
jgi:hypothetical protein